ncbi:hypothetical protein [Streptomyces mirabilis]
MRGHTSDVQAARAMLEEDLETGAQLHAELRLRRLHPVPRRLHPRGGQHE